MVLMGRDATIISYYTGHSHWGKEFILVEQLSFCQAES